MDTKDIDILERVERYIKSTNSAVELTLKDNILTTNLAGRKVRVTFDSICHAAEWLDEYIKIAPGITGTIALTDFTVLLPEYKDALRLALLPGEPGAIVMNTGKALRSVWRAAFAEFLKYAYRRKISLVDDRSALMCRDRGKFLSLHLIAGLLGVEFPALTQDDYNYLFFGSV
ncbi:MAG: hypothetical protein JW963_08935 [Anaerolineales bacterium]|nr:hypothetical protein [Anaerolineales bacterium]